MSKLALMPPYPRILTGCELYGALENEFFLGHFVFEHFAKDVV